MVPVSDMDAEVASVSDGVGRGRRGQPLSREDCLCPVCLEIFMEPVTLPCTHSFCKGCFLESVDKATLCCPMCRKRVSTWARLHSRNKTLVNEHLWKQIQATFPLQCQRRVSGQDALDEDLTVSVSFPRVCEPGELRQEYEDQISKLEQEKQVLEEEERRASEECIQRMLAEDEELLLEENRRKEEDERLARLISQQLNSASVSQGNGNPGDITPAKKKEKVSPGQIERFLCPIAPKTSSSDPRPAPSLMANKENILLSQVKLNPFSREPVEYPVAELDSYGMQRHSDDHYRQTGGSEALIHHPHLLSTNSEDYNFTRSSFHRGAGSSSVKRKSSELEVTEEEEHGMSSKRCSLPSTVTSSSYNASFSAHHQDSGEGSAAQKVQQEITEWEAELLSRRQQEEDDRHMALLLQKELDREEKHRATNRSKGSNDAYPLREKRKDKTETSTETPTKPNRKTAKTPKPSSSSAKKQTPKTSSPPSPSISASSPLSRGKQTTLTGMFSSLGS